MCGYKYYIYVYIYIYIYIYIFLPQGIQYLLDWQKGKNGGKKNHQGLG